jgi:plastocyanin
MNRRAFFANTVAAIAATVLPRNIRASAAADAAAVTHSVEIKRLAFSPAVLSIKTGDRVTWTNLDIVPHTATEQEGAWDTGTLAKDAAGSIEFPAAGRVEYFCAFHPHMVGEIIISDREAESD